LDDPYGVGTITFVHRVKLALNVLIHWVIAFFVFSLLHYLKINVLLFAWNFTAWGHEVGKGCLIGAGLLVLFLLFIGRDVMRV